MSVSQMQLFRPHPPAQSKPLFIFFSGMDGSGALLHRQLAGLRPHFDICCLALPLDDLSDWHQLVVQVAGLLREERRYTSQPVYLCGESFGACLALLLAQHQRSLIERLILINPASSFARLPLLQWGSWFAELLPQPFYRLSAWGLEPFLISSDQVAQTDRERLLQAMQAVHPRTAAWRLRLLRQFQLNVKGLEQLQMPALLLAGQRDCLLPSVEEVQRMAQRLPNAQTQLLPRSGHACLLEQTVDLAEILKESGFLPDS